MQPEIRSFALLLRSPVNHAIWQCEECEPFEKRNVFGNGKCEFSANQEGRNWGAIFWQGKAQNSSPILRCTFLARRSAKLIANFSAIMVTSLPSFSLSLYLSLSLSLSHRMYLTHNIGSASALPIIGSASALPIIQRKRERERERERERRKWRHHCRAKIGDEFTLSLAKNSHNWRWAYTFPCQKFALFVSPFTLPVSPFTERSPWWRWNSQWVHTFHCQKIFRPQALFLLFQTSRATSDRKPKTNDQILPGPILFFPSKNWIKLIPKTIGNRKRDSAWGGSVW